MPFVTHTSPLSTVAFHVHQANRVTGLSSQAAQLLSKILTHSRDAVKTSYEHALLQEQDGKVEFWLNPGAGKFCIIFLSEKQA